MLGGRKVAVLGGDKLQDQYSVLLDGTDDYISCGSDSTLDVGTSAFSVSAWFYATGNTSDDICGKGHSQETQAGWGLSVTSTERIYFDLADGEASPSRDYTRSGDNSFALNQWTHVVAVRPAGTAAGRNIYINGLRATFASTNAINDIADGSFNFKIGSSESGRDFASHISDVAFYKGIAFSAADAATLYNGGEPYNHKEGIASQYLNGWWRMGDGTEGGSGSTIYDMSGTGNDGTLQENAAFSGFVR